MADYWMPGALRNEIKWFLRGYDDMKAEYDSLAWGSMETDGQPRGTAPGDPTASRAIRAARLGSNLRAIDKALEALPEYYRQPVFEHVAHRRPWPEYADRKTYLKYRRMFLYQVAKNLGRI